MAGLHCGDVNHVINDAEGAHKGRYGCMRGPMWIHMNGPLWVLITSNISPGKLTKAFCYYF